MSNKRWVHKVLTNDRVNDLVSLHRSSLRIELYDGWPHLQIKLSDNGRIHYKTLGRTRKDIFGRYNIIPMDAQPGFVNVSWYKFSS